MSAVFGVEPGKRYFRGNLHTHTTRSDGGKTPEEAAAWYREHGYDFVAITDHGQRLDRQFDGSILVIPGMELGGVDPYFGMYHAVGLNVFGAPPQQPVNDLGAAIRFLSADGGLVQVCHPYWCGMRSARMHEIEGVYALEVFNTTCETAIAKGLSSVHWDDVLSTGRRLWGVAVDDTHWHSPDYGGGWVMVQADALDVALLLGALRAGRFYASQGPEILEFGVDGDRAYARTSPARRISFMSNYYNGHCVRATDALGTISEAEWDMRPAAWQSISSSYVRLEVDDIQGRRAWSQPIFLS